MPSAYCVRCGATYDSPKISPNGPVCRYCLDRGDIVVLLPARRGREPRSAAPAGRPPLRADRAPSHTAPRAGA